jgi:RNA polymerase-binding transcription factor DksA
MQSLTNSKKMRKVLQRLDSEKQKLAGDLAADQGDILTLRSNWEERDEPSEDVLRDMEWVQFEALRERSAAIELAQERIKQGTFGRCEVCAKPISEERLLAIPYIATCLACQLRAERSFQRRRRDRIF